MSSANYDYDENSQTWPYFALTGILVPLIPATISLLKDQIAKKEESNDKFKSVEWFESYNKQDVQRLRRRKARSGAFFSKKFVFVAAGWVLVGLLAYLIRNIDVAVSGTNFDPWKILQISERATTREIRSAYRKLSVKYHPDKVDTSKMSQKEIDAVDAAYVMINKAYKALTDDAVKENFLKYGNPDGPGEVTHGIALPKFLIEGRSSPFLVAIYILLIAVILPLGVGKWWSGVKAHTRQGIYSDTASGFLKHMLNFDPANLVQVKDILKLVSEAREYRDIDHALTPEHVYDLLLLQLARRKPENPADELLKLKVVSETPRLLLSFLQIASAFRNTDVCYAIVDAHRCLIQALDIEDDRKMHKYRQILQLPGVDLANLDTEGAPGMFTLGKLLKKPTEDPAKFLGVGDDSAKVLDYASKIPLIEPLDCKFKVPGVDYIPPSSHVHIDLRFVVKSAAHKSKPEISKLSKEQVKTRLEEPNTLEALRNPYQIVFDQPAIAMDYVPPYFPDAKYFSKNCGWVAFLIIQKDGRIGDSPGMVRRVDLSNLELTQEQFMSSDAKVSVFKLPLTAPTPAKEGNFQFRLVLKNLAFFGSDIEIPLVMKVETKPEEAATDDAYGIEPPSEDSLAGAMAQLKGDEVKQIESGSESESESESSSSDEEDSSESEWTDMDTDTEEEDEKK
ncbi:essential subunit of sec63 complex (sec66p and sec72p) [Brettanomyces bruxellensis AWRI1499]|nr:essential subunit of sec63 complex (sec66p and sec72p) [Brettanomyces bruxellensis AWRI1499]